MADLLASSTVYSMAYLIAHLMNPLDGLLDDPLVELLDVFLTVADRESPIRQRPINAGFGCNGAGDPITIVAVVSEVPLCPRFIKNGFIRPSAHSPPW